MGQEYNMDMLRVEYDIQHHLILSKKKLSDHALVRMIIATLSTPTELSNIRKSDFKAKRGKKLDYFTVRLIEGGRSRISPVDRKTYEIVQLLPSKPFNMSEREMDEIVGKYSPPDKRYNCDRLREAVRVILKDSDFFGVKKLKSIEEEYAFMMDFNPLYSGFWDLEDEEGVEDFVLSYSEVSGVRDSKRIADDTGIDEEIVRQVLGSGRKSLLSYRR